MPHWAALAGELLVNGLMTLRARADAQLGAVIANWQRALALYAHGLRAQDVREVNRAPSTHPRCRGT